MEISSAELTTCDVTPDGKIVTLNLIDVAGNPVSLRLPLDQAGALTMTLPGLLTKAVKARDGSDTARFVFPLGDWLLERVADCRALIVTLKTTDGFEVSFGAPLETCRSFGAALRREEIKAAAIVPLRPN
jgi:hypothetical protein